MSSKVSVIQFTHMYALIGKKHWISGKVLDRITFDH